IHAFRERDRWNTLISVLPLLSGRYMNHGHYKQVHSDPVLANAFHIIGSLFLETGEWQAAGEAFYFEFLASKKRRNAQLAGALCALAIYRSGDETTIEAFDASVEEVLHAHAGLATVYRRCHPRASQGAAGDPL